MRSARSAALAAGTALALAASVASPAFGDPPAGVTPPSNAIVGVGSDTTQFVLDQFALDYDSVRRTNPLYSWDATGGSPITTKTGATSIPRPDGSGAGISALVNNTKATVDFSRSSRGRSATDPFSIGFVAYAKDAVTVAVQRTTHAGANLTTQQLQDIYTCSATKWNQVGGRTASTIKPFLPQSGSGTRSFFLSAIGITDSQIGACVTQGVQENQGLDTRLDSIDAIVPYSVAKYIAQAYHSGEGQNAFGTDDHGTLVLRSVNGTRPTVGTAPKVTINPNFSSTFQRVIYNVVRQDTSTTSGIPAYLEPIFGANGYICKKGGAQLKNYGFLPLAPAQCGVVS